MKHRSDPLVLLWIGLRIGTVLWAAVIFKIHPLIQHTTGWLDRIFLAPWNEWDTAHFVKIVQYGYRIDDGTAQFHPLYPFVAKPFAWLIGQPLLALLVVSSISSLLLMFALERLARIDLDSFAARTAVAAFFVVPPAFIFFAPYAESLFLLCAVFSMLWLRERRWMLAGASAALATMTRLQGVLLLAPLFCEVWEDSNRNWRKTFGSLRTWCALLWVPCAFLLWILYRAFAINDVVIDASAPRALIYSLLISSSATRVVPVQEFTFPWTAVWRAAKLYSITMEPDIFIDFVLAGVFLVLLALAWRNLRLSYRVYAVLIFVISLSYYTGSPYPYMGMPRHLLLAFPIFIGVAPRFNTEERRHSLLIISLLGYFFLVTMFVIRGWVP